MLTCFTNCVYQPVCSITYIPACLKCSPAMAGAPKRRKLAADRNESEDLQRLLHTGGISLDGLHAMLRKVDTYCREGGTLPGRNTI